MPEKLIEISVEPVEMPSGLPAEELPFSFTDAYEALSREKKMAYLSMIVRHCQWLYAGLRRPDERAPHRWMVE